MSPSSNQTRRRVGGSAALVLVALATPTPASALPPVTTTAAVVAFQTPVVPFTGGTADLDGATTLENTQTGTKSRLDSTLLFAKDSDRLRPGAQQKLHQLALQLQHQGPGHLQVTGYTDDLGSAAHGLDLSQRRAQRVAAELRNTLPANRYPITVRGRGEADPAVPNTNETNRRKNRRVNVTLTHNPTPTRSGATPTTQPTASTIAPTPHPTPATLAPRPSLTAATPAPEQSTPVPSPTSAHTTSRHTVQGAAGLTRASTPPVPPPSSRRHTWALIAALSVGLIAVGALTDHIRRRHTQPPGPAGPAAPPHNPDPPTSPPAAAATGVQARPDTDPSATPPATGAQQTPQTSTNPAHHAAGPTPDSVDSTTPPLNTAKAPAASAGQRNNQLDEDLAAWSATSTHRPRLTLLGPVHARTRGQALARRKPYYTELLAYLTLKPHGATADEIADTFNLTTARVRTDMKILRDWLGADPTTTQPYLPDARTSPAAHQRGLPTYQVQGVLCDWQLFTQLQTRAATTTPPTTSDLEAALKLVTGQPFTATRTNGWSWIFENHRTDLHATTAIITVANTLAEHHQAHGNNTAAQQALAIAAAAENV